MASTVYGFLSWPTNLHLRSSEFLLLQVPPDPVALSLGNELRDGLLVLPEDVHDLDGVDVHHVPTVFQLLDRRQLLLDVGRPPGNRLVCKVDHVSIRHASNLLCGTLAQWFGMSQFSKKKCTSDFDPFLCFLAKYKSWASQIICLFHVKFDF